MKKYILNETMQEMDYEEAKDWLLFNLHFNLDYTEDVNEIQRQNELMEILLDSYFIIEDVEEGEYWEDDTEEREKEYRKVQGF